MPNRSTRDILQDTDANGNRVGPRAKVAPPTQSAFGPASSSAPAPALTQPAAVPPPTDLSAAGAAAKIKQHAYDQDKAIDDAS